MLIYNQKEGTTTINTKTREVINMLEISYRTQKPKVYDNGVSCSEFMSGICNNLEMAKKEVEKRNLEQTDAYKWSKEYLPLEYFINDVNPKEFDGLFYD